MTQRRQTLEHRGRWTVRLVALAALAALGSCGIANDSVPRDIEPTRLESLKPKP